MVISEFHVRWLITGVDTSKDIGEIFMVEFCEVQ